MFFSKFFLIYFFLIYGCAGKEETFIQVFQNEKNIKIFEIDKSSSLKGKSRENFKKNYSTYPKLLDYYKNGFKNFSDVYKDYFTFKYENFLGDFKGTLNFDWPEIHMLPYLPVTPVFFDENSILFEKLEIEYNSKLIYGLRFTTRVNPLYKAWGGDFLKTDMAYLPSVNARIMGFQAGQIIAALSKNIKAADKYFYNGLKDWSAHSTNKKEDQFNKPLKLSNFMHSIGDKYVVSADPDFALEFIKIPASGADISVITFFFWKTFPVLPEALPDFVYQIIFNG